jgi:isoleucyl-tRNA synthetase
MAEEVHRHLRGGESVHLCRWPEIPRRFADPELLRLMALWQRVAALGHGLRKRLRIRVRQALARLRLHLPDGMRLSDSQRAVICEELNAKALLTVDSLEHIGTLRAVPDARRLGARLGAEVQQLLRAAKAGHARVVGGRVIVTGNRKEWSLKPEEVTLSYTGREGLDVAADEGVLLALDATMTAELREEGLANEVARAVQRLRKNAGYDIADRIVLEIEGPLSERWRESVADAALAEEASIEAPDAETHLSIDGRTFRVSVARAA